MARRQHVRPTQLEEPVARRPHPPEPSRSGIGHIVDLVRDSPAPASGRGAVRPRAARCGRSGPQAQVGRRGALAAAAAYAAFFRHPHRVPPNRPASSSPPPTGEVALVDTAVPPAELGHRDRAMPRVSIFLSVLDVHVQRVPVSAEGYVPSCTGRAGSSPPISRRQRHQRAQQRAARHRRGPDVVVVQIAGSDRPQDRLRPERPATPSRGETYGLIRFGSRVDTYFPAGPAARRAWPTRDRGRDRAGRTAVCATVKPQKQPDAAPPVAGGAVAAEHPHDPRAVRRTVRGQVRHRRRSRVLHSPRSVPPRVLDTLDGRLARMLNATSKMGGELDSLADAISFGVSPALVLYVSLLEGSRGGWVIALVYVVAIVLRLARFNTLVADANRPPYTRDYFVGVPAPAGRDHRPTADRTARTVRRRLVGRLLPRRGVDGVLRSTDRRPPSPRSR